jgi:hypothetical protein
MALSFSSSVTLRDARKTFFRAVQSGETPDYFCRVLPPAPFKQSLRYKARHDFAVGSRVVLLSLTAAGWISSGFRGTIVSFSTVRDSQGRESRRAQVEWDAGITHPAHIGVHALSRLRPLNHV